MLSAPYSLDDILRRSNAILELLGAGAFVTCLYLTKQFRACDVTKNDVYKLIYSRYYGLKGAGLSELFFHRYFEQLENTKDTGFDPFAIAQSLKQYPNRKGQLSLQFSFISKIGTTFDPDLPIYDSRIVELFGIRNSKIIRNYDERLFAHLEDYEEIKRRVDVCLNEPRFLEIVNKCREINSTGILPDRRLADLILWAYHQIATKSG